MIPELDYQGPLIINKGGKYSGFYRNPNGPAIWVQTSEPVDLYGVIAVGVGGDAIKMNGYTSVNLMYSEMYTDYGANGEQQGKAVNNYMPRQFVMEHNYFEGGSGINIDRRDDTKFASYIKIRYNKAKNINKAKKNGTNGGEHAHFVLFNTVRNLSNCEISWNQFINEAGKSWCEDLINMFNSSGTPESPILIHNNYLYGAYPLDLKASSYTGSGITVDGNSADGGTFEKMSAYVKAYDNQVISMCNAGMNIAAGHNISYTKNRIISASMFPDGTKSLLFWSGTCIFDGSNVGSGLFKDNEIKDNVIGYNRWGTDDYYYPVPGRHDENKDRKVNLMPPGLNTYLDGPITLETEKKEWDLWLSKLRTNNIFVGTKNEIPNPSLTTLNPATTVPNTNTVSFIRLVRGQEKIGKFLVLDDEGVEVGYDVEAIAFKSSDKSIVDIYEHLDDEGEELYGEFVVMAKKVGEVTCTITIPTESGKFISQSFKVIVKSKEAANIKIIFT